MAIGLFLHFKVCYGPASVVSPNDVDVYYIPKGGRGATYLMLWDSFGDLRAAVNRAVERSEPPKCLQDVLPWQLEEVIWTLTDPEGSAKALDELQKAVKDFEKYVRTSAECTRLREIAEAVRFVKGRSMWTL
jgi:hypothetical protein